MDIAAEAHNIDLLTRDDMAELLVLALGRHPDLYYAYKIAYAKADARALSEPEPPPPFINYPLARGSFYEELHAFDDVQNNQPQDFADRLLPTLNGWIDDVTASVNANSPDADVENAFVCLQKFAGQVGYAEPRIKEHFFAPYGSGLFVKISACMMKVGKMLRERDVVPNARTIGRNVSYIGHLYDESTGSNFKEVNELVWPKERENQENDVRQTANVSQKSSARDGGEVDAFVRAECDYYSAPTQRVLVPIANGPQINAVNFQSVKEEILDRNEADCKRRRLV